MLDWKNSTARRNRELEVPLDIDVKLSPEAIARYKCFRVDLKAFHVVGRQYVLDGWCVVLGWLRRGRMLPT
jgi:hypothetical protein